VEDALERRPGAGFDTDAELTRAGVGSYVAYGWWEADGSPEMPESEKPSSSRVNTAVGLSASTISGSDELPACSSFCLESSLR
jgi:hypothetical protein